MVSIGVSSFSYRWAILSGKMSLRDFLERAVEHGATHVQICENLDFIRMEPSLRKVIGKEYAGKIVIETGYKGHDPVVLSQALLASADLGASMMRLVPENPHDRGADIDRIHHDLASLLPLMEQLHVGLTLENHFSLHPLELVELVKRLDSPLVSICFDCFNSITLNVGTFEALGIVESYITRVHVKDVVVSRVGTGFSIKDCQLGQGILDFPRLKERISRLNKPIVWLLEGWLDESGDQGETLIKEKSLNNKGLTFLRRELNE